jgi:hypothetical protein
MNDFFDAITFTAAESRSAWGYPLPHLLALHLEPDSGPEIDTRITFFFSTEKVILRGRNLDPLWSALVTGTCLPPSAVIQELAREPYGQR